MTTTLEPETSRSLMDKDIDDSHDRKYSIDRPRKSTSSWVAFLSVVLTIIAVTGLLHDWSFYTIPTSQASYKVSDAHDGKNDVQDAAMVASVDANRTSDFVLDSRWDFDAPPQRREYEWIIREKMLNPDGVFRLMLLVNDQFPGPMIEANEGDTIIVHLSNQATNATSIHWHGLYQNGTNDMDGTTGVTQCPIAPGINFTYEFNVSGQHGTYWWHSHMSAQASDGMYGPCVIHSKKEHELQKLQYASDRVLMVSDHYYDLSSSLFMQYLASDRENIEPVPDTVLINGKGIRDCDTVPKRRCDDTTEDIDWLNINLETGQRHRLRFINTGALAEIQVSLDEQDFAITEVDGVDVLPERFHRLTILPGQRYSIVLGPVSESQSLWLRVKMLPTCFSEKKGDLQLEARAKLTFLEEGSMLKANEAPVSTDWDEQADQTCRDMNTSALIPAEIVPAPITADASCYLRANFEIGAYRLSRGFFNQSSFRPRLESPTLSRVLDGLESHNPSFGTEVSAGVNGVAFDQEKELVLQTNGIQVVDLTIVNFDDGAHPFHLHGYKYSVLAQGHGYPPEDLASSIDLSNPPRRDTATIEGYGWMLMRIIADNPGIWAFHCHVTWHSEAGLVMQLVTRADALLETTRISQMSRDLCAAPREELYKGATPSDEVFMHDD